jgi:hypothetical protein
VLLVALAAALAPRDWFGRRGQRGGDGGGIGLRGSGDGGGPAGSWAEDRGDGSGVGSAGGGAADGGPATVWALLIGIDAPPPNSGLPLLRGAIADMELLKAALLGRDIAAPAGHVKCLYDGAATPAAIERALASLRPRVHAQDLLIVAYSGHGGASSSADAGSAAEGAGARKRSFLYTHGGTTDVGTLLSLLGKVPVGKRMLLVDACRSGTPGPVSFDLDPLSERQRLGDGQGLVWMSSCAGDQSAIEVVGADGRTVNGLFMQEVAAVLNDTGAADADGNGLVNYTELVGPLVRRVSDRAEARGRRQTPRHGIVNWNESLDLLPARHRWSMEGAGSIDKQYRGLFQGRLDPTALAGGDRLYVVVVPAPTKPLYYPQDRDSVSVEGDRWNSYAYLGEAGDSGVWFEVRLVQASAEFDSYYASGRTDGQGLPPLDQLLTRARMVVQRP